MSRPFWIGAAVGLGLQVALFLALPFLFLVLHWPALWAIGFTVEFEGDPRLVQVTLLLSGLVYAALVGALAHVASRRRRRRRPGGARAADPDL